MPFTSLTPDAATPVKLDTTDVHQWHPTITHWKYCKDVSWKLPAQQHTNVSAFYSFLEKNADHLRINIGINLLLEIMSITAIRKVKLVCGINFNTSVMG